MIKRISTLTLLLFFALISTAPAQKPVAAVGTNVLKKELQLKLDEWHKAGKFPGATLGVVLADGESFGLAVGYSDRDAKTPMRPDDRMLAGSVGKTFAAATAFQLFKEGKTGLALAEMSLAASLEDNTIKHPVTPGEVIPARELLADMLLQMNRWDEALAAYEAGLKKHPNRFNGLYGAGVAAELSGRLDKARSYYKQLHATTDPEHSTRPELKKALQFLQRE